jgi:hypothetical protein
MLLLTFAALAAFLLPGCIVWEIRDQLKQANAQLSEVNGSVIVTHSEIQQVKNRLNTMNADLGTTNDKLLEANTKLVDVQSGLTRVDTTNSSLGTLDQQLTGMQASLTRIDGHLASLSGTIGKLDGAIPFLDLGGDAPVEPAPTTEPTAPAPADASQPATTPTTDAAPRQPREQLLGTWISATPNRVYSLTLLSDGKFLLDTAAPTGLQRGTWKRESQRITLMPDSTPAAQAPTPNTTTSQPSQPAPQLVSPAPSPQTLEIAHQSTRSVTFIDGNTLIVVRRP